MVQTVTIQEALAQVDTALRVDVRSPSEFAHGHIPGAVNVPLLDDRERHLVGLCYAEKGKDEALKLGLDLVGPHMRFFIEAIEAEVGKPSRTTTIQVYCWRGGMRSASLAWLLDTSGWRVQTIVKGYKAWRGLALQTVERPWKLVVLSGHTGCGKTKVLRELRARNMQVVDLEATAGHKGSAFGWLGEDYQPTQEHFDNLLAAQLLALDADRDIWLEDESRRIGAVNIPAGMWQQIQDARVVRLHIPKQERVRNLVADYGTFSREDLADGIQRISKKLGSEQSAKAFGALSSGEYAQAAEWCLSYYDKYYQRGMDARAERPSLVVECAGMSTAQEAEQILALFSRLP